MGRPTWQYKEAQNQNHHLPMMGHMPKSILRPSRPNPMLATCGIRQHTSISNAYTYFLSICFCRIFRRLRFQQSKQRATGCYSNDPHAECVRLPGWCWWLVLIFCERKILLAGWCWFCVREKYCWLDAMKMKLEFISESGGPASRETGVGIAGWRLRICLKQSREWRGHK